MRNYSDRLILKILGSGCCVPRIERSASSYFVAYRGKSYLLDCGPGALRQLLKAKEDYKSLDGVIFSHFHPDHVADFIPLIQALDYTPNFQREKPLEVIGPKGTKEFIEGLYNAYRLRPKSFDVNCIELDAKYNLGEKFFIESIKGNHTANSIVVKVSYQCEDGKFGFVYSGDTDFDENIAEFAKETNLLILECSFPNKIKGHLTPEEAGQIAQKANPRKLMLTHFYPPCDNPDIKIQHRVKEYFLGKVLLAQDFLEIVI